MANVVFDASAVLVLLNDEAGADAVAARLQAAAISTVNVTEVLTKLSDYGMTIEQANKSLSALQLTSYAHDQSLAVDAAALRPATRARGLSLGDCACLALAARLKLPVLTADGEWAKLDLPVRVELFR